MFVRVWLALFYAPVHPACCHSECGIWGIAAVLVKAYLPMVDLDVEKDVKNGVMPFEDGLQRDICAVFQV